MILTDMTYGFVDTSVHTLEGIRGFLDKLGKGILLALYLRSDYAANPALYIQNTDVRRCFRGSRFDEMFRELLLGNSKQFKIADEVAFYDDQPPVKVKPAVNEYPEGPSRINISAELMRTYLSRIDKFCREGDGGNYDNIVVADANVLDLVSTRVHRGGIWVADIKRRENPKAYDRMVRAGANDEILAKITDTKREEEVLDRVYERAGSVKVDQAFARDFFRDPVIRLTKQVQIYRMYELLGRK